MKCDLAKDLIVLYAEDLCSPATAEELKEHLVQCPECSKYLEEYKQELEKRTEQTKQENVTENTVGIKPLKKVKKKLAIGRVKIAILFLLLVVVAVCLGVLSYGQVTNECLSFSAVADTIRIQRVCNSLAKGDVEPFMDIFAYRIEDQYTVAGSKEFTDFDEYIEQVELDLKKAYEYYFAGKNVTVKVQGIDQYAYAEDEPTDITDTDIMIGFYEKDKLLYEMAFGKVSADKFIVYEVPKNGEPGFTTSMLPYYDASLDICLHFATKTAYENLNEKKSEKSGAGLALVITTNGTDEEKETYRYQVIDKVQTLCDSGWYYKEVMYFVDEYDSNAGKWIYKVWFMLENQSNGELVMLEQRFHYYEEQLYVIKESPAIIIAENENLPTDIKAQLLAVFE